MADVSEFKRRPGPRRVALIVYNGVLSLDVTGPVEVFSMANDELTRRPAARPYAIEVLGLTGDTVRTTSGLRLGVDRDCYSAPAGIDTLIVAGGDVHPAATDERLRRWLLRTAPKLRRLASVCSGSFVLAEAGLLDGLRATTHWAATEFMQRRYPQIRVEADAIFVRDGRVCTSAGVTAGIDMSLALVEEDHGHEVALAVARRLVVFLQRPGGQSQFSRHLAAQAPTGPLRGVAEWIVEHLGSDLSVESLAARAAMSPRNFARVFVRELGSTPAKFVELARIDAARRSLENGCLSVEEAAAAAGFHSAEQMRRTFLRHLRVLPVDYRRRFQLVGGRASPQRHRGSGGPQRSPRPSASSASLR
jgi:transcriptional regulator GlxA family with amidase domain